MFLSEPFKSQGIVVGSRTGSCLHLDDGLRPGLALRPAQRPEEGGTLAEASLDHQILSLREAVLSSGGKCKYMGHTTLQSSLT